MAHHEEPGQLNAQTMVAFDAYIRQAEREMEQTLHGAAPFLWSQQVPERAQKVREAQIVAQFWSGQGPNKVPSGLIHDWIAAAFIPDSTIHEIFAEIQDYDNHKNIYKPEVIDSKLIRREGNDFQIYLRLLKKKIITVVLDTDHEVHYRPVDRTRWVMRSFTTRIAEVAIPSLRGSMSDMEIYHYLPPIEMIDTECRAHQFTVLLPWRCSRAAFHCRLYRFRQPCPPR